MSSDARQRRLELILESIEHMVVVMNHQWEIEWVNPAYTRVTGWALEEVTGRHPRHFHHGPRTNPASIARVDDLLRQGSRVADLEMLNYKKSGEPFWVSLSIAPVVDERSRASRYVAIQSDITERKRREAEMAQRLHGFAEAQRIARFGHMEHDLASGSVHCSAEIYRILDSTREAIDASYEGLMAFAHPEDVAGVRERYEQAVNASSPYESKHRVISKAGRIKWVHLRGALEGWDNGSTALFRIVVQDITAHHR